jgi:hypothetical protein
MTPLQTLVLARISSPMPDAAPLDRHAAALEFLLGRINYERVAVLPYGERQLKLDRMRTLLNRLGNPDAGLPIVHVAGTKGKGSTSALVAAIVHAAGYDVGVYSSPHLERLEERFAINGVPCSADELVALVDRIRPIIQQMDDEGAAADDATQSPTFFEITTALALMYFADRRVDAVVLEVGLGSASITRSSWATPRRRSRPKKGVSSSMGCPWCWGRSTIPPMPSCWRSPGIMGPA